MSKQKTINKAMSLFDEGYACSQAILLTFCNRFGMDQENAKRIASTFGGGMGRLREKCGAVTGGFMVLGLAYGNTSPQDMKTKLHAYRKVRELDRKIKTIHGTSTCAELLEKHVTESEVTERKHHKIICCKVVGDVTGLLYDMLDNE
jgi:C_GCAxxG_C_C family probable redox protein